jgi:hypothetical protein
VGLIASFIAYLGLTMAFPAREASVSQMEPVEQAV